MAAIAPGLGEYSGVAAGLTRVMMPFLLLVSLSAVAMGMLNAQGRFTAPALAPALFNVGSIAVGAGLWWAGWPPERAVQGWAAGDPARAGCCSWAPSSPRCGPRGGGRCSG